MPVKPVITNSTPLIAFWSIQRLDILKSLFGEIWIAPAVEREFTAIESEQRKRALAENDWIKVVQLIQPGRVNAFVGLDIGEAETLALAEEMEARLVLLDERKARRYAQQLKLKISGSMGILLLAKEARIIAAVSPVLEEIQEAGLYISTDLMNRILVLAGE